MMDKVQKKDVVLGGHKPLSKPHTKRGKATSFMTCSRDGSVQWVVKDGNV